MNPQRSMRDYLRAGWGGMRMLEPYIARDRGPLIASALLIVLASLVGILPAMLSGHMIDALTRGDLRTLSVVLVLTLIVQVGLTWLGTCQARVLLQWQSRLSIVLKKEVFTRIHRARVRDLTALGLGQMLNRAEGDVDAAVAALASLAPLASACLTLGVLLVAIPLTNLKLSVIGLVVLPLWVATVLPLGKRIAAAGQRLSNARDAYITMVMESLALAGLIRIKGFGTYDREARQIVDRCTTFMETRIEQYDATRSTALWQALLMAVAPACIMWFGAWLIIAGECTLGTLMTFAGFFGRAFQPTTQLANLGSAVMGLAVNAERLAEVLELPSESSEGEPLLAQPASFDVRNVSFAYGPVTILSQVNLVVERGEQVVVMGPSGCGKTTLLHLLLRYNEPSEGSIAFCERDLSQIRIDDLRRQVGYVPQDPQIFAGTIFDNLVYGVPTVDMDELNRVIEVCQLREFIDERPDGLDALVTSQGGVLSGGQRQRIAIARTLLTRPTALLLDEATSALNVEVEQKLFDALLATYGSTTMVIVSHRPCTSLERLRTIHMGSSRGLALA